MHKKEKIDNSLEYLEQKIKKEKLSKLFKNNEDRNIFISEYMYFKRDGNNSFYLDFIDQNFNKKGKIQEDALELAIVMKYFKAEYVHIVKEIIYSKRNAELKLLCLDWLFNFRKVISSKDFKEINNAILIKSKNELLRIQTILNLLLIDENEKMISLFHKAVNAIKYPSAYYRILSNINNNSLSKKVIKAIKKIVFIKLSNDTKLLNKQREELLAEFQ